MPVNSAMQKQAKAISENAQTANDLYGQLCLVGGGSPFHDAEIRHVLTTVPSGTGISVAGPETVPEGYGQLDSADLRHLAVAGD